MKINLINYHKYNLFILKISDFFFFKSIFKIIYLFIYCFKKNYKIYLFIIGSFINYLFIL